MANGMFVELPALVALDRWIVKSKRLMHLTLRCGDPKDHPMIHQRFQGNKWDSASRKCDTPEQTVHG